jgi:hypothetical protein
MVTLKLTNRKKGGFYTAFFLPEICPRKNILKTACFACFSASL